MVWVQYEINKILYKISIIFCFGCITNYFRSYAFPVSSTRPVFSFFRSLGLLIFQALASDTCGELRKEKYTSDKKKNQIYSKPKVSLKLAINTT